MGITNKILNALKLMQPARIKQEIVFQMAAGTTRKTQLKGIRV